MDLFIMENKELIHHIIIKLEKKIKFFKEGIRLLQRENI